MRRAPEELRRIREAHDIFEEQAYDFARQRAEAFKAFGAPVSDDSDGK